MSTKIRTNTPALAVLAALALAPALVRADDKPQAPRDRPVDKVQIPPMKPFDPPKATSFTLKNGITCFVLEDHDLPLVDVTVLVRAGSVWDPEDKVGLASLAGHVWRTGGTSAHPKEALDEVLDKRGATLEASVGLEQGSVHLSALKEDADLGLSLLRELLEQPAFPEEKLQQAKRETAQGLRRRNDAAPSIASRVFAMKVFGKTSPVAREIDRASLAAVKRDDLVSWHKQFVNPASVIVGAVGDLDAAAWRAKLEKALESWSPADAAPRHEMPLVEVTRKASWTLCPKADVNQSMIMIGHVGGVRSPKNVDEYAKRLCMDLVLGGNGFASRLMMHVRTDKGLAYDTGSSFGYDYGRPGTFMVYSGTESKRTAEAVDALLHEVQVIRSELCTDEELSIAKDSFLNMIPAEVDTSAKVMSRTLRYAYWGFPQDSLKTLLEALAKVTKEDVLQAAKEYVHPEDFTVVVCGNPADFDNKLDTLTKEKVEVIEDAEAWAHPTKNDDTLLAKLLQASGGKKAIASLTAFRLKKKQSSQGNDIPVEFIVQFPDKFRVTRELPQIGKVTFVVTATEGFAISSQGTEPFPAPQLAQIREQLEGEPVFLLRAAAEGSLGATLEGEESVGDRVASKVTVKRKGGGAPLTIFLDKETGTLVGRTDGSVRVIYSEPKAFGGILLPTHAVVRKEGAAPDAKPLQSSVLEEGEANPKLDEKTFAAPEGK